MDHFNVDFVDLVQASRATLGQYAYAVIYGTSSGLAIEGYDDYGADFELAQDEQVLALIDFGVDSGHLPPTEVWQRLHAPQHMTALVLFEPSRATAYSLTTINQLYLVGITTEHLELDVTLGLLTLIDCDVGYLGWTGAEELMLINTKLGYLDPQRQPQLEFLYLYGSTRLEAVPALPELRALHIEAPINYVQSQPKLKSLTVLAPVYAVEAQPQLQCLTIGMGCLRYYPFAPKLQTLISADSALNTLLAVVNPALNLDDQPTLEADYIDWAVEFPGTSTNTRTPSQLAAEYLRLRTRYPQVFNY